MKNLNFLIVISEIINLFGSFIVMASIKGLGVFMLLSALLGLFACGQLLFAKNEETIKSAARLFMGSCFLFVPIGLLGIIGATKILNKIENRRVKPEESHQETDSAK